VKRYLFSAKGAVSLPAWGNAPGLVKSPSASVESAIHFGTAALNRAFSAHRRSGRIPGAAPQAKIDIAPLALNTCVEIDAAIYKPSHNVILSEAKNLGSEMFRSAQYDNAIDEMSSNYAS
jgi:hypothetical protein